MRSHQLTANLSRFIVLSISALLSFSAVVNADIMRGTPEEAQAMVAKAIEHYNQVGSEAAFDKFTNDPAPEFSEKDLYVFVINKSEDLLVAHGKEPMRVGEPNQGFLDADGVDIGVTIINTATPEGAWAKYKYQNFESGKVENKSSWVVLHDGYIFGVGVYKQ